MKLGVVRFAVFSCTTILLLIATRIIWSNDARCLDALPRRSSGVREYLYLSPQKNNKVISFP